MAQIDRRVRRTKKSLKDALIALALEKDYDVITIQEITDRADIGYRTFFRHYADKDELLQDVISAVSAEMRELMGPPPPEFFNNPNIPLTELFDSTVLFQHVQENSDLYRLLLFSDQTLVQPLKDFAIQEFKSNYGSLIEIDIPMDIITNHMISSMISLLRWWLENDMPISPEVMGGYAHRLIILPIRDMVWQSASK
jgi:AcrR family transcriptional regulator